MKFGTSLQKRDVPAIAGMACAIASPASPGRGNLKSKAELLRRNDKVSRQLAMTRFCAEQLDINFNWMKFSR